MRKLKLFIFITLLMIPLNIYALEASLSIECESPGLYQDKVTNCTIKGHSDGIVTGLETIFNYDEDLEISEFKITSAWDSMFGLDDITSGVKIEAVANAQNDVSGDFEVATFSVSMKEEATSLKQVISLNSIIFYDEDIKKVSLEDEVKVEFEDYIDLDNYQIDDTKMIIYGLTPMNIGTFKSSIATNALLRIMDKNNELVDDENQLATGHLFRVSFKDRNIDYKISILGDVLGDGRVSKEDAKRIAMHIIDGDVITDDEYLMAADYDANSVIKMNDVVRLLKSIEN